MKKNAGIVCTVGIFVLLFLASPLSAFAKTVYEIRLQGAVGPPMADFVDDAIKKATDDAGEALLILLDTPGGLDTSMRQIVKSILDARIPIIVFVYPQGARAASAGAIILLASSVAAMAPGTNVGAAHPVSIGKEQGDKVMMKKVLQDAQAYARSLANKRGRNAEWAVKAVRQSASITAHEAKNLQVIDVVAENPTDLLNKIDGRTVEVSGGKVKLATKNAKVKTIDMPFKYKFLSHITDPNVAYILMMLGLYGILFEIYSPGAIFPGVIGGICLILAFYAFSTIPISYAGLFLILLGIVFFVLELKITSYGALTLAGITSIVIGSVMLIDLPSSWLSISWGSIVAVALLSMIFFLGVLSYAVKAQLFKVQTGKEGLIGETAVARTDIDGNGKVFLHGELWNATSDEHIAAGGQVTVVEVRSMTLHVRKGG